MCGFGGWVVGVVVAVETSDGSSGNLDKYLGVDSMEDGSSNYLDLDLDLDLEVEVVYEVP